MSDKEEVIRKGKRAEQLMADPVLTEALNQIRQDQFNRFESSSPENEHLRQEAYYMLKAVEALGLKLSTMCGNAKFEEAKLAKNR